MKVIQSNEIIKVPENGKFLFNFQFLFLNQCSIILFIIYL
jgi:hypothetical protein